MPDIKSLDRIAEKFITVTPGRAAEYERGVAETTIDWAARTAAAEARYKAAMTAAMARGAFGKGVRRAGTAKWKEMTIKKGPGRWSEGIAMAGPAYAEGFAPYREVIANTTLPERGPAGDPKNIERVRTLAKALHDKKIALAG